MNRYLSIATEFSTSEDARISNKKSKKEYLKNKKQLKNKKTK